VLLISDLSSRSSPVPALSSESPHSLFSVLTIPFFFFSSDRSHLALTSLSPPLSSPFPPSRLLSPPQGCFSFPQGRFPPPSRSLPPLRDQIFDPPPLRFDFFPLSPRFFFHSQLPFPLQLGFSVPPTPARSVPLERVSSPHSLFYFIFLFVLQSRFLSEFRPVASSRVSPVPDATPPDASPSPLQVSGLCFFLRCPDQSWLLPPPLPLPAHPLPKKRGTKIDGDEDEPASPPHPRPVASSRVSPVPDAIPPDALPSPLQVSGLCFFFAMS